MFGYFNTKHFYKHARAFFVIVKEEQQRNILPFQSNLQKGLFQGTAAQLPFFVGVY